MSQTTVVSRSVTDTYTDEAFPARNYGYSKKLFVQLSTTDQFAYIFFPRPFPLGATINSAKLYLYQKGTWAGAHILTCERVTSRWSEKRLKFDTNPNISATNSDTDTHTGATQGQEWEFVLTAMMQDVSDGLGYAGFRISINTSTSRALFSGEATDADFHPRLEVTWSKAPEIPTDLSPSGNRKIGEGKPIVRCNFTDNIGNTEMDAINVQIDAANDFSAGIDFDSGTVATTVPSLDLNATAYGGLADGSSTWWRVKVRDGSGLWSGWSASAQFTRDDPGVLTITNPPAPAGNTVEETTPPISWTFTGETQEAYSIELRRRRTALGLWKTIWTVPKTISASTSHAVDDDLIDDEDSFYQVIVRVWDNEDRESVPRFPKYVQASRDFTYVRSGSPTAPTGLTVTEIGPKIRLNWSRASQPDYWKIKIGNKIIEPRIPGADAFVSGTAYQWDFYGALPGKTRTYGVEAVVLDTGKLKHSNPTTLAHTFEPIGIWLVAEELALEVFLGDQASMDLSVGENGETFYPLGSRRPIRVVDSVRGYEGAVTGMLMEYLGVTADTYLDRMLTVKGASETTDIRLIFDTYNFRVELGEIAIQPTPYKRGALYGVAVNFWQVADFDFEPESR